MPEFKVDVQRTIECSVKVLADTPQQAREIVNNKNFELPPRNEWYGQEDWEYRVNDHNGRTLIDWDGSETDEDDEESLGNFPVKPLTTQEEKDAARDLAVCGTCGRYWDDAVVTEWTPAPSGRCPFEYFHERH